MTMRTACISWCYYLIIILIKIGDYLTRHGNLRVPSPMTGPILQLYAQRDAITRQNIQPVARTT